MSRDLMGTKRLARLARVRGVLVEDEPVDIDCMLQMPAWALYLAQLEEHDAHCATAAHLVQDWAHVWDMLEDDEGFCSVVGELADLAEDPYDGALLYMVAQWVKSNVGVELLPAQALVYRSRVHAECAQGLHLDAMR